MLEKGIAAEVLNRAVSTGGDFAEIFLEDRNDHQLQIRSGKLETVNSLRLHGAGVRVFTGTNAIYVYTNDTSLSGLLTCAGKAADAIKAGAGCTPVPLKLNETVNVHPIFQRPDQVKASRKAQILRNVEKAARQDPRIVQVVAGYSDSCQRVWIANTDGLLTGDTRVYTRVIITAIASDGKENQTGYEAPGAMMGFEIFNTMIDPEKIGANAAAIALLNLEADLCPAGVMPVIIDNGFGGVIFHEACGHSLEATSVAFGASEFTGKIGQVIAAKCVTAIDDGTIPNEWGSINIDDEGMPTGKLTLIKDGVLENFMIDKLGGLRMNMPPTGSSRRQSYAFAPTSRMRNTYIAAGPDKEEEMIRTIGDGLYAKRMGGGSVNPATGEFNFAVLEGYLIKDGKIDKPVRGASLIGRGSEILQRIDRVGGNMQMSQGMCGSMSGSVPTNVGQPMIRVTGMTVGGQ